MVPHLLAELGHARHGVGVRAVGEAGRLDRLAAQLGFEGCGEVAPECSRAAVEVLGHLHPQGDDGRLREVVGRQPLQLPVGGEDGGLGPVRTDARVDNDGPRAVPAAGHVDDVPGTQCAQRLDGLRPAVRATVPGGFRLCCGDPRAQPEVLLRVTVGAGRLGPVGGDPLMVGRDATGEADHGPVGLELCEGLLQQPSGPLPAHGGHEVHGHVVGGLEGRAQRVGAARGQPCQSARVKSGLPAHDSVAFDVDAPTPRATGQLGVLASRDVGVGLAVVLHELLEYDAAGGHVDAEGKGLCREDHFHQPCGERLLHSLLEGRQQPGVVRGDPVAEGCGEGVEFQRCQILAAQPRCVAVGDLSEGRALCGRREPQAGVHQLRHCRVAALPGEDEEDRRQQPLGLQPFHRRVPARDQLGARISMLPCRAPAVASRSVRCRAASVPVASARAAAVVALAAGLLLGQPHQFGIHVHAVEQLQQPAAHHHMLVQRDGAALGHDDLDPATHLGEPVAELLSVADRRGQGDQLH